MHTGPEVFGVTVEFLLFGGTLVLVLVLSSFLDNVLGFFALLAVPGWNPDS